MSQTGLVPDLPPEALAKGKGKGKAPASGGRKSKVGITSSVMSNDECMSLN